MISLNKWIDKVLVISSAGVPGGVKLLAMLLFPLFEGKNAYACFSRDFSFANSLLMLSGVSYSILLYKKLNGDGNLSYNRNVFWNVFGSYFSFGIFQIVLVALVACFLFEMDFLEVIFLAIFTGVFFVSRGYYIFFRLFYRLFVIDFVSVCLFLAIIFLGYLINPHNGFFVYIGIYVSSLIPLLFIVLDLGWDKPLFCHNFISKKEVSIIGWSNFTSVGISFFIPMLIQGKAGEDFIIYSSMASLVFSIITVIPRGMMNDSIGQLSLWVKSDRLTKDKIYSLQRRIFFAVVLLGILICICFMLVMGIKGISDKELYAYILLLCVFLSVGQLSIVEATIMYLGGEEKKSLFANCSITIICIIMSLFSRNNIVDFSPISIMIGLIILYLVRWIYYCSCMNRLTKK